MRERASGRRVSKTRRGAAMARNSEVPTGGATGFEKRPTIDTDAGLPWGEGRLREEGMEGFFEALGTVTLVLLIVVGVLAGWIAGTIAGRRRALYLALGVGGAVALPFILAALGVGILAAGGVLAILIAALVGAVIVLVVAKLVFD